jgi:hypothetical protein
MRMPWADRETREKVLDFIRISRAQVGAKLGLNRVVISAAVENAPSVRWPSGSGLTPTTSPSARCWSARGRCRASARTRRGG